MPAAPEDSGDKARSSSSNPLIVCAINYLDRIALVVFQKGKCRAERTGAQGHIAFLSNPAILGSYPANSYDTRYDRQLWARAGPHKLLLIAW
jgi:hypothetical protein